MDASAEASAVQDATGPENGGLDGQPLLLPAATEELLGLVIVWVAVAVTVECGATLLLTAAGELEAMP